MGGSPLKVHAVYRHSPKDGLHHPQSTRRRHRGILVGVHSVLLPRTDDFALVSFFQLNRGDNVLKLQSSSQARAFAVRTCPQWRNGDLLGRPHYA